MTDERDGDDRCLTSAHAPERAAAMVPADDAFGRLILTLLYCSDAHPHAEYYRQLFSLDEATSSLMALWEDGSEEAKRAAGSLSFERSRRSRREMLREYAALADTGELPSLSLRQYLHGKLALQTRAFAVEDGRALIPVRRARAYLRRKNGNSTAHAWC